MRCTSASARTRWESSRIYGIDNGWVHLAAALLVGALVGVVIGFICLRTSGMAFIMITLAFAQMLYFLAISLKTFGGDDGLTINARSDFGLFSLRSNVALYYAAFVVLIATLVSACAPRAFALRHGDPRRPQQRAAHGRARVSDAALQADGVRDFRARMRRRRRAAREPHQVRGAVVHGVAGLGRPHRDDRARAAWGRCSAPSSARSR